MTYAEAIRTTRKLFPGCTLKRTDNARRCLVMSADGMPVGDGKSWLEALRSAGTFYILKNKMREKEAEQLAERLKEFNVATGWDPEKLTLPQVEYFDVWMACKDKGETPPPPPEEKPLVSLR